MGYPYVYTGPTNYGVMPMDNSVWPDWVDSHGDTRHQCPLSATHNGLDGRTANGHVDDYWDHYGQPGPDPWQGNWPEHPAGECTGDFMRTSQWVWPDANWNWDGATRFFFDGTGAPVHGTTLGGLGVPYTYDGGYGLKRFFETRGYPVSVMYNQYIQGAGVDPALGYTFADYMTAINTGYPVLLHLEGHTVVGVGYDSASHTVYLNDAWDHKSGAHSMTWGGSYAGMQHFGVTVVELPAPTAVKLVRFEAEPESAEIHVEWETASEIDNLGFNLYRAGAESGPWVRLNDAIIPSKAPGAVGGAVYAWLDDGVVPGVTYYYRLEAIDVYGTSTFHGPISATAASQRLRLPSRGMPRRMP
jgi:hypothetical protein